MEFLGWEEVKIGCHGEINLRFVFIYRPDIAQFNELV
jgi:hypothetical protein